MKVINGRVLKAKYVIWKTDFMQLKHANYYNTCWNHKYIIALLLLIIMTMPLNPEVFCFGFGEIFVYPLTSPEDLGIF